jgi:hypothetical protein
MQVEITFKNGDVWEVKPLYIADYNQYVETEDAYYIVPCKDILVGRVSAEEFQISQKEAKKGAPIGAPDLGQVLYSKTEEKVPCKFNWKEVKGSSS